MLRVFFPRCPQVLAAVLAVGFMGPQIAFSAPPPGSVKLMVFKTLPEFNSGRSIGQPLASSKVSLYDRLRPVLIHPEPKRIINGRCVMVYQRFQIPRR